MRVDEAPNRRSSRASDEEFAAELHAMLTRLVGRAPLFADLRSRNLADDLVQDAILAVTHRMENGPDLDDPFAYAARCVQNLAKKAYGRERREQPVGVDVLDQLGPPRIDVAEHAEQRATMREVLGMVRSVNSVLADLDPVDLELVRAELLRTDQKQLAKRLGLSRPTLYRRKRPAMMAFVSAVAAQAGTKPCPDHAASLVAAAALSGFGGARAATTHAATCPECRATIVHLAVARHGLALLAPIPALAMPVDASTFGERLQWSLQAAADGLRYALLRSGDPTPLTGSAAKTAVLVAAACTGGGGIYCAVDGVPGRLTSPFAQHAPHGRPARGAARPAADTSALRGAAAQAAAGAAALASTISVQARAQSAAAKRQQPKRVAVRRPVTEFARRAHPVTTAPPREFRTVPAAAPTTPEFTAPTPSTVRRPSSTGATGEFSAP
ncbi:sigma-70 family RNA polymerase sigma factor [Paraconexibacter antarcticus]|uniref:Sigma-70 family RNA polymerase sigma factor n=1 Tax=Paraconexibacter antarcticus TaxID=2949664 RepID=A0ABY5DU84_9ACTN|nr:sigma-70 family RNA polymerase sigma factor [Paraconexibacter antarcticus]UTI65050.1 sigma-70 family RNA polymerase sigma factor [Paraconexibacter antarcticus]